MVSDEHMLEAQDAGLARMAELTLAVAEKLHLHAQAEDEAKVVAELATALERCARSYRLTCALRAKLRREAAKDQREAEERQAQAQRERVRARQKSLKNVAEALTWRETDFEEEYEDEAEAFDDALEHHIYLEALQPGFLSDDFDAQVARVLEKVGYRVEGQTARRIDPAAAAPPWRSSA